jgi:membrane peptidoglycan carboxypeptidase
MSESNKGETVFSRILKFVGLNAIVGLLVLILTAPLILLTGTGSAVGIALFDTLPDTLKPVNGAEASTLYGLDDAGNPVKITDFYEDNRISIAFEDISDNFKNAVIATEDPRFYSHGGVDWISLVRASVNSAIKGGGGPGASTITMQYVRNNIVETLMLKGDKKGADAARAPNLERKLREIRYALAIEQQYSKKEIFAGYANLSFFGNQIYGVEAASEYYFGKKASELNIPEGALLAGMLQSPNAYKPDVEANLPGAKIRRDYVIQNMADAGYITQSQADDAKATAIKINLTMLHQGCEASQETAFFCDYVVWTVRNSPEFGPTFEARQTLLRRGGLEIYSTMNVSLQKKTDATIKKRVPLDDPNHLGATSVSVEVGTGRVLAMSENRFYDQTASGTQGHTSVNFATDKNYGGSSGFQTGSAYKVFTLATWLQQGKRLGDKVDGRVHEWLPNELPSRCGAWGGSYKPKNSASHEPTNPNVSTAMALSINTAFMSMASQLDLCDIRDTALAFGVHRADGAELAYIPASVLGVNEIAPITMAVAEAALPNQGIVCTPIAIDRVVVRSTGKEMTVPKSTCTQATTPEVAAGVVSAMRGVIKGGTAGLSNTGDGVDIAGKTGTTDHSVQTWMTGYSSKVSTTVWVGNVVGSVGLGNVSTGGKSAYYARHDIWRSVMKLANTLYKPGPMAPAPSIYNGAGGATVPDVTTMDPTTASSQIQLADLNFEIVMTPVLSDKPSGTVAYTIPRLGAQVTRGTIVKVYMSSGGAVVVPSDLLNHGPTASAIIAWLATNGPRDTTGNPTLSAIASSGQQSGNCGPNDRVTRTQPAPGAATQAGTIIELFCGN